LQIEVDGEGKCTIRKKAGDLWNKIRELYQEPRGRAFRGDEEKN